MLVCVACKVNCLRFGWGACAGSLHLRRSLCAQCQSVPPQIIQTGQWIESVTDWAIRITDWGLFPDWVSSHARLADPIRPMPNKGKSGHSALPIALIPRLPDWVVQSVLPIAIHRLLHRFYPLASSKGGGYPPLVMKG